MKMHTVNLHMHTTYVTWYWLIFIMIFAMSYELVFNSNHFFSSQTQHIVGRICNVDVLFSFLHSWSTCQSFVLSWILARIRLLDWEQQDIQKVVLYSHCIQWKIGPLMWSHCTQTLAFWPRREKHITDITIFHREKCSCFAVRRQEIGESIEFSPDRPRHFEFRVLVFCWLAFHGNYEFN